MNYGIEKRMIGFAEKAGEFSSKFISAIEKIEKITNVDRDLEFLINTHANESDNQLNHSIEELEGRLQLAEEGRLESPTVENGQYVDGFDVHNSPETIRSEIEKRQKVLAYREELRSAAVELDNALQTMQFRINELEALDIENVLQTQIRLNEMDVENGYNPNAINNRRMKDFIDSFQYYKNLVGSVRKVFPSRLKNDDGKLMPSQAMLDDTYNMTVTRTNNLVDLINNGRDKNDRSYTAVDFNGLDQLALQMESKSIDLNKNFQKPVFEFELVGDEVSISFRASGRTYKFDGTLSVSDMSLQDVQSIVRALTSKYVANSQITNSGLLQTTFNIANVNGKGFNKTVDLVTRNDSPDFMYADLGETLYKQITDLKKQQDMAMGLGEEELSTDAPEVTEPKVTEPEITEPEVTEPEVTEPEVTEPEVTEPEVTEPEVTEPEVEEPEITEPEVAEPEVEDNGIRVTAARPFEFDKKLSVGNDNKATMNDGQKQVQKGNDATWLSRKAMLGLVAAAGVLSVPFGATFIPALGATALTTGMATIIGNWPTILKNARIKKLNKLADDLGLKVGYNIDEENYQMRFCDADGNPVDPEELAAIADEKGIDIQGRLDKIANNKFRGKDYEEEALKKDVDKVSNRTIKKMNRLAKKIGAKVDTYYFEQTGKVALIPADAEIYSNDVEFTEEVEAELRARRLNNREMAEMAEEKGLDPDKFIDDKKKIRMEASKKMRKAQEKDRLSLILVSKKARKLNDGKNMEVVTPDNLEALFDDLGGVKVTKRRRSLGQVIKDGYNKFMYGENGPQVDTLIDSEENTMEQNEPEVEAPEINEPEVTEPEVTEPEVAEPEVTEPEVAEPEVAEPEVAEDTLDPDDEIALDNLTDLIINETNAQINQPVTPVEEVPAEEVVDVPVEEAPVAEPIVEEAPVVEAPVAPAMPEINVVPAEPAPVEEAPVVETPVVEAPVAPAMPEISVVPAEPAPVEVAPVVEAPVAPAMPEAPVAPAMPQAPETYVPVNVIKAQLQEAMEYNDEARVQAIMEQNVSAIDQLQPMYDEWAASKQQGNTLGM